MKLPVFYHLFDGVGRTLDNFSCSNPVDNSLVQPPDNSCHVHKAADLLSEYFNSEQYMWIHTQTDGNVYIYTQRLVAAQLCTRNAGRKREGRGLRRAVGVRHLSYAGRLLRWSIICNIVALKCSQRLYTMVSVKTYFCQGAKRRIIYVVCVGLICLYKQCHLIK